MADRKHRIGITLSGGGARGLAHIGVLKVLVREDVEITALSGASMGGIIAALLANGFSPQEMEEEAKRMSSMRNLIALIDIKPPRRGLVAGERVRQYLSHFIPADLTFQDLEIPLILETVDAASGRENPLSTGSVLDALMATSAFPGIFPAVDIEGIQLIDGGVLHNLPVHLLGEFAVDHRLAVDVAPSLDDDRPIKTPSELSFMPEFARELYNATQLMAAALTKVHLEIEPPDLLLRPPLSPEIGLFVSFTQAEDIVAAGEAACEAALPAIRALLGEG